MKKWFWKNNWKLWLKLKWFWEAGTFGDRASEKQVFDIERSCSRSGKLH